MQDSFPIAELRERFTEEMRRANYSSGRRCTFNAVSKRLVEYADSKGVRFYTVDFGQRFLSEMYPEIEGRALMELPNAVRYARRTIVLLNDFKLNGSITRKVRRRNEGLTPIDLNILSRFKTDSIKRGYSISSSNGFVSDMRWFIRYLHDVNIPVENISESDIVSYMGTQVYKSQTTIRITLFSLKRFLLFLYDEKLISEELSSRIPKRSRSSNPNLPSVWKPDDVEKVLAAIDLGSPLGKRDYAIILLVTKLGIRTSDVVGLKMEYLKWPECRIEFTQSKTNNRISLPLPTDVGWAIIDYLKNGRPCCDLPYVFVTHTSPVSQFCRGKSFSVMIAKYANRAGISFKDYQKHGLHSLRHTLACRLLEANTPLPIISEILGHSSPSEVKTYLSVNIEKLRACALNPEEVFANAYCL